MIVRKNSRYGMGATGTSSPCPSLEQLLGISDVSDPCQAAAGAGCYDLDSGAPMPCTVSMTTQSAPPAAIAPSTVSQAGSFLSQNPGIVLGALGILAAIFIAQAASK